jgi:hypothetical protein
MFFFETDQWDEKNKFQWINDSILWNNRIEYCSTSLRADKNSGLLMQMWSTQR